MYSLKPVQAAKGELGSMFVGAKVPCVLTSLGQRSVKNVFHALAANTAKNSFLF
jgi:hypothetical protein